MKKLNTLLVSASLLLGGVSQAYAVGLGGICPEGGAFNKLCGGSQNAVGNALGSIVTFLFVLAAIIALVFLVIGGIKWITAQGDSKKIGEARDQIINALIGLAMVFISYILVNIILFFFTGSTSLNNLNIPTFNGQ